MDNKIELATEVTFEQVISTEPFAELNEVQLMLVGGGSGDVVFA